MPIRRYVMIISVAVAIMLSVAADNTCSPEAVAEKPFIYEGRGKRDPFVPLIRAQKGGLIGLEGVDTVADINLEGIIWDPKADSIAILNGVIMKEGDLVGNVKMLAIMPDKVKLQVNDEPAEIFLEKKEE